MADLLGADVRSDSNSSGVDNTASEELEVKQRDADQELIKRAHAFLDTAQESEDEMRRLAIEDIDFSIGNQWPDNITQERFREGRPCLVINRIPQFVQQVANDQRQNRPSIKVHPVGDGADVETAKIMSGLIRHIEYNSNADVAYDRAFDSTVRGGFGYWRLLTAFVSHDSFDQEIYIKSIRNQFSVYLDPRAQEPDGSDANEAMICEYLDKSEFKRQYPDAEASSADGWETLTGNQAPLWIKDGAICVAEYFYKEWVDSTLHLLSTGESVLDDKLQERLAQAQQAQIAVSIVSSRPTQIPKIKWCKMNGIEIIDRGEWPGKYIPIVPVYGSEIYSNGKRTLEGIVRHAKDPQRMLNYWRSAETEAIALAPRAPFVGAEGQFEGHEKEWQEANRKNQPFLQYKPTSIAGQPIPPPQRQAIEPAVQAISLAARSAADDLKATTGIYDPALGAGPGDMSGVAIQKRNVQSQTANFHLIDNLTRAIRHTGRILIDVIPHVYDTERTSRIIGEDGTQKTVRLNQTFKDESGKEVIYKLDAGTYDVTVDVGPSFASKRQEAAASMQDAARSFPRMMDVAGDLFVKNMDWPGAQDIADRIRKVLPPGIADDPSKTQIPPQVQAQMQQMSGLVDQLSKQLHAASQDIAIKRFELEHKERIELAKIQADIEINLAKLGSQSSIALLQEEFAAIKHRLELAGWSQPMDSDPNSGSQNASMAPAGAGQMQAQPMPTGGPPPGQPMGAQ